MKEILNIMMAVVMAFAMALPAVAKSPGGVARPAFTTATTRPAMKVPRPALRSLAPTNRQFNWASGRTARPNRTMQITRDGLIKPHSAVPTFNRAAAMRHRFNDVSGGRAPANFRTISGQRFAVPNGAVGPIRTLTTTGGRRPNGGLSYVAGRVTDARGRTQAGVDMRVMPSRAALGKRPPYPHGYVSYERARQKVDPANGRTTLSNSDPRAHIPMRP